MYMCRYIRESGDQHESKCALGWKGQRATKWTTPFDVNSKVCITIMGTKVTIDDALGGSEAKNVGFPNILMDWEGKALPGITKLHAAAEPPEEKTILMNQALSKEGATGSAVSGSAAAKPSNVAAVLRRGLPAKGAQ